MKPRKDSADKGAGSGWMARLVVLLLFISVGQAFASGCQTDRSQMVALEVLPPWVFGLIVVGCPIVVLARLVWGPSPWGIQQHKEEEQTQEQNDQGSQRPNCVLRRERNEARRLAEKYRNLSCDSQDEADETLLPWETPNPNEL